MSINETGSPRSSIDRTFQSSFQFQNVNQKSPKKAKPALPPRRNPVNQALEWQRLIGTPGCRNQADLARRLGVSRARVSQVLSVLKLDSAVITMIADLGDPMSCCVITERCLRQLTSCKSETQRIVFRQMLSAHWNRTDEHALHKK